MMSVGCNDLDSEDPTTVFNNIKGIVSQLTEMYPHIKIIIAEVTPRMDDRDAEVIATNNLINQFAESSDKIFVIKNSNLRDPYFFYQGDSKHIRKACIGRFAANIKHTLRVAYGRKKYTPPPQHDSSRVSRQQHQDSEEQQQPQQQQQQHLISEQLQLQQLIHFLVQQQMNHQNTYPSMLPTNEVAHRFSDSRVVDIRNGFGVT